MIILMLLDIPQDTGSWVGRFLPVAEGLAKKGHIIEILMPSHKVRSQKQGFTKGLSIRFIGPIFFKKTKAGREHYSTTSLFMIAIKNLLNMMGQGLKIKPDLIYVGKPLPVSSSAALILRILHRKPVIVDCDDYEAFTNLAQGKSQSWLIRFFEDNFPKICDHVISNTTFTKNRLQKLGVSSKKITYIPNGVDESRFKGPKKPLVYTQLRKKKVLYFGDLNLSTGHSVDILLKAFKILKTQYGLENLRLVIVGDGKDEVYLKSISRKLNIDGDILWIGRVQPEEIKDYLSIANVVVDPVDSKFLGNLGRCPLKILEAMHMGIPVVTSDVGDRKLILGDLGIFVKAGDEKAMAGGLAKILIDDKKSKLLVEKMKNKVKDYRWSLLVDSIDIICKNVLD